MLGIWAAADAASSGDTVVATIQTFGAIISVAITTVGAVYGVRAHREAKGAKVEARGAHINAYAANHAVNNVPPGTPRLVQRVAGLEDDMAALTDQNAWQSAAVRTIADQIGVDLPPTPGA